MTEMLMLGGLVKGLSFVIFNLFVILHNQIIL